MNDNFTINGDFNNVGKNITQKVTKISNDLNKDLVVLIQTLVQDQQERENLLKDFETVKNENESVTTKSIAGSRLGKFLKVTAGEAGKVLLKNALEAGLKWVYHIPDVAEFIKNSIPL